MQGEGRESAGGVETDGGGAVPIIGHGVKASGEAAIERVYTFTTYVAAARAEKDES